MQVCSRLLEFAFHQSIEILDEVVPVLSGLLSEAVDGCVRFFFVPSWNFDVAFDVVVLAQPRGSLETDLGQEGVILEFELNNMEIVTNTGVVANLPVG
jgi:hypothetical protein